MLLLVTLVISFVALTRLPYAFIYVLLPLLVAAASTSVFGTALIGCLNTCFIAVLIALGVFLPSRPSSVSASRCCTCRWP
ncbi:hypothetical protein P4114_30425 [Pseudomonas aeruginosa]|uniref:hypothetical protein n=1 Tax=Pseudomonas aeruginosa TaxID=287 RepID=UPI002934A8FA|nr:hypothetical protein [Pseudomonas aeruginosa]MDF5980284.1 hypothetical protein [Pseudomonas aeruginosa]